MVGVGHAGWLQWHLELFWILKMLCLLYQERSVMEMQGWVRKQGDSVSIRKEYLDFYIAWHNQLNRCLKAFLLPLKSQMLALKSEDKWHFGSVVSSGTGSKFSYCSIWEYCPVKCHEAAVTHLSAIRDIPTPEPAWPAVSWTVLWRVWQQLGMREESHQTYIYFNYILTIKLHIETILLCQVAFY